MNPLPLITSPVTPLITTVAVKSMFADKLIVFVLFLIASTKSVSVPTVNPLTQTLALTSENIPGPQLVHVAAPAPEYLPTSQLLHTDEYAAAYVPDAQLKHSSVNTESEAY